jgi:hypothetical protein
MTTRKAQPSTSLSTSALILSFQFRLSRNSTEITLLPHDHTTKAILLHHEVHEATIPVLIPTQHSITSDNSRTQATKDETGHMPQQIRHRFHHLTEGTTGPGRHL